MKLVSKCERQFVSNCIIKKQKRVDGRNFYQGRTIEIVFGKERGCCMVLQGNTRVLVQVTSEVSEPKAGNQTEGVIHVNLELSAMAASDAKTYLRSSEEFVEAQRSIERCIRDSKCLDLESLCIVSASKVWTIRVDIHTLNDDGNLTECASIAAISALAHFRRPEVTVVGTDVTVHSVNEKDAVPLNLRHMPVSINLALFDQGKYILVDPNEMEEKVCDGCYVIGMNAHQEICFVHRRGVLLLQEEVIKKCEDVAIKRAQEITQIIRSALDDDNYKRATNASIGFTNLIQTGTVLGAKRQMAEISLDSVRNVPEEKDDDPVEPIANTNISTNDDDPVEPIANINISTNDDEIENSESKKNRIGNSSKLTSKSKERALQILQESESSVFEGGYSRWGVDVNDESSDEEVSENNADKSMVKERMSSDSEEVSQSKPDVSAVTESMSSDSAEEGSETKPDVSAITMSSDSEEESVYIDEEQLDMRTSRTTRGWFTKNPF